MKKKLIICLVLAWGIFFGLIACNSNSKTDETKTDSTGTKTELTTMPPYDPEMDPVKVEAPFLKLHKDTLGVKLYEVTLNPGDSVGMHTHPDHVLYVVQGGKLEMIVKDAAPQVFDMPTGMGMVFPAETHRGKNIGTTVVKLLVGDIYRSRN
jgi:quercetin dioxygenase-like cupin family protein